MEHAVGRIPQLCPQWTNHNPSDPGITLLELLAWYKEMQQYHMNCCTDDIRRKLLGLAGGDIRPAAAARCGIRLLDHAGARYPALSRLETPEGVVFELLEEIPPRQGTVAGCWVAGGAGYTEVTAILGQREAGVHPFAFGGGETEFLIALSGLPERELRLWFEVRQPRLAARNPFAHEGQLPRSIRWSWEGAGGAEVLRDETHALSVSGYITFRVPEGLEKSSLREGLEACWHLRATLLEVGCEETVCLTGVEAGRYQAAQQESWSQIRLLTAEPRPDFDALFDDALAAQASFSVFLRTPAGWRQAEAMELTGADGRRGVRLDTTGAAEDGEPNLRVVCADPIHYADLFYPSTGLPDQTIPLDFGQRRALSEHFQLICDTVQADGSVRPEVWRCVDDLYAGGPRDRIFVYDPVQELIRFGDGRTGAIVPRGENAILLAGLVLSDCGGGNIPEGDRLRFAEDDAPVWNTAAVGGADGETTAQAAARFLRRLELPHKCVSAADYEAEARSAPGLRVASARAIPGYDPLEPTGRSRHPVVTVVVIPASHDPRPMPDRRFLESVQAHLNGHRPIGTVVRVMGPRYIGVTVSAQLRSAGPVDERQLRRAAADCLAVGRGGRGIGDPIALHRMSAAIQNVPEVLAVERLQLHVDAAGCTETGAGDILLPENAVAYLKDCLFTIR